MNLDNLKRGLVDFILPEVSDKIGWAERLAARILPGEFSVIRLYSGGKPDEKYSFLLADCSGKLNFSTFLKSSDANKLSEYARMHIYVSESSSQDCGLYNMPIREESIMNSDGILEVIIHTEDRGFHKLE